MRKLLVALAALMLAPGAFAQNVKIGIVAFISGPAAAPFGVPAKNSADFVIDELNGGKVPAPYNKKGFGGATLETVIVDEAGTTTTQVTEFRNLVQKHVVDRDQGQRRRGALRQGREAEHQVDCRPEPELRLGPGFLERLRAGDEGP